MLDDFLKLVRQNGGGARDKGAATSPLSFRGAGPQQGGHRKQWSGSDNGGEKLIIREHPPPPTHPLRVRQQG